MQFRNGRKMLAGFLAAALVCSQPVIGAAVSDMSAAESTGLCEHHPQHTAECGYQEARAETPCDHVCGEECYQEVVQCSHVHTEECYPSVSGEAVESAEGVEREPSLCTHVCSVENGCVTLVPDCIHTEHDAECGYAPAVEGQPCYYQVNGCAECQAEAASGSDPTPTPIPSPTSTPTPSPIPAEADATDTVSTAAPASNLVLFGTQELSPVETVQAMIDALPTAEELAAMSQEEQGAVYTDLQTAYDAYEALSDTEKLEVTGAEIFDALFAVFNSMTNALDDSGFTYTTNGTTRTYTGGSGESLSLEAGSSLVTAVFAVEDILSVTNQLSLSGVNGTFQSGTVEAGSVSLTGSGKKLTISGGTLSTGSVSVTGSSNELVISGGALTSTGAVTLSQGASLSISTGTLTSTGDISLDHNATISGGAVKANSLKTSTSTSNMSTSISITGGVIDISGEISSVGTSTGSVTVNGDAVVFASSIKQQSGSSSEASDVTSFTKGVVFVGNTGKVYGEVTLPGDLEIPSGYTLEIPQGAKLTIPDGVTLTNYGTISGEGTLTGSGSLINIGTVDVTNNTFGNSAVAGAFRVSGDSSGYSYADGVLTVNDGANLTISMASNSTSPTSDRIVIAQSATATITLDGVKINAPQQQSAIDLSVGSKLILILPTGTESSLVGGGDRDPSSLTNTGGAGIHVPSGATLNIKCSENSNAHTCEESSCGSLSAKGNPGAAGIGGKPNESCGTVVINGGIVKATGGNTAAGIGGGDKGSGGDITINGGIVTAIGNRGAAGIGGAGEGGTGGKVTITGGIVTATDTPSTPEYGNAAGIGGGYQSAGAEVIITGGIVTVTGNGGAGIGGGTGADNGSFSTNNGNINGNAVIFASSNPVGNEIGDLSNGSNWSGVIFRGTEGKVYGDVTLTDSFTIPQGYTLYISGGNVLTIPDSITVTNSGTIIVTDGSQLNGQVSGNPAQHYYSVNFVVGDYGTAPESTLVAKDGLITRPADPTADGYTFDGWYKDEDFTELWNFETDTVTNTTFLYAKWTADEPVVPPAGDPTATPTPTGAPTATPTPSGAPTATPTPSGAPTATPAPSGTPTTKPTGTITPTPPGSTGGTGTGSGTNGTSTAVTGQTTTNAIKTGDETPVAFYVIILLTAVAGAGLCVIWKRTRKKKS